MIEKLVTIPVKVGYSAGKTGAQYGAKLLPKLRDYLLPVVNDAEDIDYASRISSRRRNKDVKRFLSKNPEKSKSLDECIDAAVEKYGTTRKLAATVDTVDKMTAPIGLAGDYLIFMGGKFTLAAVEEALEMALAKGPFMYHYARNHGMKRIPGWLTYEFFSHVMPGGDLLDLRNNYVNSIDKDIENYAVNLFRQKEELAKPAGWLSGLWNKAKSYVSTPKAGKQPVVDAPLVPLPRFDPRDESPVATLPIKDDEKETGRGVSKLPDPYYVENRIKAYMEGLKEGSYGQFMKTRKDDLPQELERFVQWGLNQDKPNKWYTNKMEFARKMPEFREIIERIAGKQKDRFDSRKVQSAYELNVGKTRKYILEFDDITSEDYSKARDMPSGAVCPSVMVAVLRNYKVVVDADHGSIEDIHVEKKEYHTGLRTDPCPLDKKLETQVPELIAAPAQNIEQKVFAY